MGTLRIDTHAALTLQTATRLQRVAGAGLAMLIMGLVHPAAEAAEPAVTISIGTLIVAEPSAETPLSIQISPAGAIPSSSFLRLRGVPVGASLSEGNQIAAGTWAVPLVGLPNLKLVTPLTASGRNELLVSLVTANGDIVSEAHTVLLMGAAASIIMPNGQTTEPVPAPATSFAALTPSPLPPPTEPQIVIRPARAAIAPVFPAALPAAPVEPAIPKANLAPKPPALSAEQSALAKRLVDKGDEQITEGNIAAARNFYEHAAEMGLGLAALKLAATFDEAELKRLQVIGVGGDSAVARKWYETARALGAPGSDEALARLGAR